MEPCRHGQLVQTFKELQHLQLTLSGAGQMEHLALAEAQQAQEAGTGGLEHLHQQFQQHLQTTSLIQQLMIHTQAFKVYSDLILFLPQEGMSHIAHQQDTLDINLTNLELTVMSIKVHGAVLSNRVDSINLKWYNLTKEK